MKHLWVLLPLLAGFLTLVSTGCQTTNEPSSGYLATVTVTNRPRSEIAAATVGVFQAHGYQGGMTGPSAFRFQRPAGKLDQMAYGDLFGGGVAIAVTGDITPQGPLVYQVGCNAVVLQDPGDPIIEEQYKVHGLRKGPYQDLLNQIEASLR